ncbi:hypothetical protein K469DRAFT_718507 [Zopfia rhizophila CBS 207.26]|uniref:Uncharacterized protein n=1 Tax=Zopfia rhizophila CBS 207.26 TaxID=1314779 RepID=A0A6A6DIU0_9PEZI|nr:hypothetical protein K469DRAFT_718507 [Zopfia rhizophila CBS 207.26]
MRAFGLLASLPLMLSFTVADLIPALRREPPETHLDTRQSTNPFLGKRQFCNAYYPYICFAVDGDSMCMAADEVCCQVISTSGAYPYVCDVSHPYCCPSQDGVPMCGSDESCGGGEFEAAPSNPLATETSGAAATRKTAEAAPTRVGGGTAAPEPVKTNAAERVRGGAVEGGVFAVVVLGGLAVL